MASVGDRRKRVFVAKDQGFVAVVWVHCHVSSVAVGILLQYLWLSSSLYVVGTYYSNQNVEASQLLLLPIMDLVINPVRP